MACLEVENATIIDKFARPRHCFPTGVVRRDQRYRAVARAPPDMPNQEARLDQGLLYDAAPEDDVRIC